MRLRQGNEGWREGREGGSSLGGREPAAGASPHADEQRDGSSGEEKRGEERRGEARREERRGEERRVEAPEASPPSYLRPLEVKENGESAGFYWV